MSKKYPVKPPVDIGQVYQIKCGHCQGSGQEPGLPDLTCRECIGRGRQKWRILECETCNGKGKKSFLSLRACPQCRGQGWIKFEIG